MSGSIGNGGNVVGYEGPASVTVDGNGLSSELMQLLVCDGIQPGNNISYQMCKVIYEYHPLGGKIIDAPIRMAQSQEREISVGTGPDEMLINAFQAEWIALRADQYIAATVRLARIYGIASIVVGDRKQEPGTPLDMNNIAEDDIYFNVLDPLNTSGSITLCQDPNSPDFQKPQDVAVAGVQYHRSRVVVIMNEAPIYISWTTSAFGFVGRSVFQRALYPLKSFIQTMITDDMVSRKAGLLVARIKQPGSVVNQVMSAVAGIKRQVLQLGATNNVISIAPEETIETLNMMNIDGAGKFARDNIIKNISTAVPMPARWITEDSLAEGFGEGSEDAKSEAVYIDTMRREMQPLYERFDDICMRRAWSPTFYATVQEQFPKEYGSVDYETAFYDWKNAFKAVWPDVLRETDSEKSKTEKVKFEAMVELLTLMLPVCDPENKARLVQWAQDNTNAQSLLFPVPLELDAMALAEYQPPQPAVAPGAEGEGV